MSQRNSGYQRVERDAYQTPAWASNVLAEWLRQHGFATSRVWEPAAGKGQMVDALRGHGFTVTGSDIDPARGEFANREFLSGLDPQGNLLPRPQFDAIVTNPPYKYADAFVRHALAVTDPGKRDVSRGAMENSGLVAMLLKVDFDSAKTRRDLFADAPHFRAKIVLTDRIQWFSAWFVWDWHHAGPAGLFWAGKPSNGLRAPGNRQREIVLA